MDKHRLFPNCDNRENDKIHTSDIAKIQKKTLVTPEDVFLAESDITKTSALEVIANIQTSLQSLKPMTFNSVNLDELYLLQKEKIRNLNNQLETLFLVVRQKLNLTDTESQYFLNKLVMDSLKLGKHIGAFNERIDALKPMQNDRRYKSDRQKGAKVKQEHYQRPFKNLINDVLCKILSCNNEALKCVSNEMLAKAIEKFVLSQRQTSLSIITIKKYIKSNSARVSKAGRRPITVFSIDNVVDWLNDNFKDNLAQYFVK